MYDYANNTVKPMGVALKTQTDDTTNTTFTVPYHAELKINDNTPAELSAPCYKVELYINLTERGESIYLYFVNNDKVTYKNSLVAAGQKTELSYRKLLKIEHGSMTYQLISFTNNSDQID